MRLSEIGAFLFPFRAHLEREIDFLKAQLAQERRRVDQLQAGLIDAKRPTVQMVRPIVSNVAKPVPKGWDATRMELRDERAKEISARPDAGREDPIEGDGSAA
jgi:hypothetical protein